MLSREGIKTNVTVTFSPLQAMLAAKCGATYISPFVGRLDAVGHFGMELVRQIRTIYDNYGFKTEIIVAAVRHPTHVLEAALAGADVCTMAMDVHAAALRPPADGPGGRHVPEGLGEGAEVKTHPLYLNGQFESLGAAHGRRQPGHGRALRRGGTTDRRAPRRGPRGCAPRVPGSGGG